MPSFSLIRFIEVFQAAWQTITPASTNIPIESNLNLLKLGLVWAELSKCSFHLFPSARAWRYEPWRGPWPWASTYSYTLHCFPACFHWTFSFLTFWISRSLNTGFPDSRPYTGFPRSGIFTRPCVYWLAVVCQGRVGEVLSSAHLSRAIAGPLLLSMAAYTRFGHCPRERH